MDGENNFIRKFSLDSLGYGPDGGGLLAKLKESKMRRFSDGIKNQSLEETHFENLQKNFFRTCSTRTTTTEKGSDYVDTVARRNSFKNHKKSFHKHFPAISETENLINVFTCALQKEVLYHGKMFISDRRVCFHSSVLLKETKIDIYLSEIQFIKKTLTARVVPNAISIITKSGDKYLFGSLLNRDSCFKFLQTICPELKVMSPNGSPQVFSAENFSELEADTVSSYSSQEDSAESRRVSDLKRDTQRDSNVPYTSSSSKCFNVQAMRSSTTQDTNTEGTAVSWVTMVTETIKSILSTCSTTNINKVLIVYLVLAMLLLLSSGYIGLRIAALEKQLNTLGENPEFSIQREDREM